MTETSSKTGLLLHKAAGYDLLVWLLTLGRTRAFRETMLSFARLQPVESVLDVGCGTGSLAMAAKRQVGADGSVDGVDAAPEMIARARKKARSAGLEITFQTAYAQSLPFPGARFDVVLSTLMLHHLPQPARQELAAEIRRVLKPGGRVLVIDFGLESRQRKSILDHIHRRHGSVDVKEIEALLTAAGLEVIESGPVGTRHLHYVVAKA